MRTALAWRSALYVPASSERFLARAQSRGADALILDLEDGVAPDARPAARRLAAETIAAGGPSALAVRLNGGLRDAAADLDAVVRPGLAALLVAKCADPGHLRMIARELEALEGEREMPAGSVALVPVIEHPAALSQAESIARADPRCAAMLLGTEDFAAACGMDVAPEVLTLPKQLIVFAARAAGIAPLGLMQSVADFTDIAAVRAAALRARAFGYDGATCVHPALVPVLNEAFTPDSAAVAEAQRIVDAMAVGLAAGQGAVRLDGRMIDAPVAARAERVLALAARAGASAAGPEEQR